jgi:hypothetical protein
MIEMRNIVTVAKEIKELIGENEQFKNDIDHLIFTIGYTVPEVMYLRWNQLEATIQRYLPSKESEYNNNHIKIVSIFYEKK